MRTVLTWQLSLQMHPALMEDLFFFSFFRQFFRPLNPTGSHLLYPALLREGLADPGWGCGVRRRQPGGALARTGACQAALLTVPAGTASVSVGDGSPGPPASVGG